MTEPTISAIIPVYNGANYLRETLDSVVGQTKLPDEVLLVDDGSTDGSAALIAELVAEHSSKAAFRVITQPNAGQSAARNAAVEAATGELLAFLDQDDLWYPGHVAALSKAFASDQELGWVYSDFDEIDGEGRLITRRFIAAHQMKHPKTNLHQILGSDLMVLPSASILRRTAYLAVGGFDVDLSGYEDDELFLRMFRGRWTSQFVPKSLTMFRTHTASSSRRGSFRRSRMIFLTKVAAEVPDEVRTNRMYVSDLLIPRLLEGTIAEYSAAVSLHQDDEARAIVRDLRSLFAARRHAGHPRTVLWILARPRLTRALLRLHRSLPRALRPRLNPALRLRD
jgi:glycosyltransferase involved in cell wall biosynthesis